MEFKELVYNRRSNRALTGGTIPAEDIRMILDAGLRAPNACNFQSWHFYCITDREKIEAIVPDICSQTWIRNSSIVIVITEDNSKLCERWGKSKADLFTAQDSGTATENILLMASDLGYAGCFVGAFDEEKCRELLGAGENERPVSMIPIGTYENEPPLRDRKPFEEMVTFIGTVPDTKIAEPRKTYHPSAMSLPMTQFIELNLEQAVFDNVNLEKSKFNNINFSNARFTDINMTNTFFDGLCMNNAYFGCVDMQNATFENPNLTGTEFKNCSFMDVRLENCDIENMTIDGISIKELLDKSK